MLTLHHISKSFGQLHALTDISLTLPQNKITALLGENGAGKSTLMNILFGLTRPSSGSLSLHNSPIRIPSPNAAQRLGIGMVHQHFKLVPSLTLLQNLNLFVPLRPPALRAAATAWLTRLHWSLPLDAPVSTLSTGQQQRTEILKALLTLSRSKSTSPLLILDEPTAVLTPPETADLFAALKTLRDQATTLILITHKLAEVQQIADHLLILRKGKLVHDAPADSLPASALAEKMIGAPLEKIAHQSAPIQNQKSKIKNPPTLTLQNLSTPTLHNLSLSLHPGEILGIAGVDGNGQSPLVHALLGTLPLTSGTITLTGRNITHFPLHKRLPLIAHIAEDRHAEALVLPLSIRDNLLLKDYRTPPFSTYRLLRFRAWRSRAQNLLQQFDIRAASPLAPVSRLSGGNQQKVVLARELSPTHHHQKPLIIAHNPTRGLDVGAAAFALNQLLAARDAGAAILLIHSDLDELLSLSTRVAVLYNGTLTHTPFPDTTKDAIGRLMLGLPA